MLQKQTQKLISLSKLLLVVGCWLFVVGLVFAYTSPGNPAGFVNDFAGVLSSETKASLEGELSTFAKSTGNEISVVTIQSLNGDVIENYANTLFREWGIGSKDKNTGALLLLAIDDHKFRIEVGYGLEGVLTDIATYNIERGVMVPKLKEGNYDLAVTDGINSIVKAIGGEAPASVPSENVSNSKVFRGFLQYIPLLIFFVLQFIFGVLAPTKSWWLGGVLGGVVGGIVGFVAHSLFWALVSGVSLAGLGLIFDYLVSKAYQARGKNRHDFWTRGGFWGGGIGGSGGGGGFGGFGGGSSGGGGSSSSW